VALTAGAYAESAMSDLLKNLHLKECQMDALWSFVNKKKRLTKRSLFITRRLNTPPPPPHTSPLLCAGVTDKVWDIKRAFEIPYIYDN
jgi:hypothetical protein